MTLDLAHARSLFLFPSGPLCLLPFLLLVALLAHASLTGSLSPAALRVALVAFASLTGSLSPSALRVALVAFHSPGVLVALMVDQVVLKVLSSPESLVHQGHRTCLGLVPRLLVLVLQLVLMVAVLGFRRCGLTELSLVSVFAVLFSVVQKFRPREPRESILSGQKKGREDSVWTQA